MSAKSRIDDYGMLGAHLYDLLGLVPGLEDDYSSGDMTNRLSKLTGDVVNLRSVDPLLPSAVSLLCLDYPLQLYVAGDTANRLIRHAFSFVHEKTEGWAVRHFGVQEMQSEMLSYSKRCLGSLFAEAFPKKGHLGASLKTHLAVQALAKSWVRVHSIEGWSYICWALSGRATEDQLAAVLLWADSAVPHMGADAWRFAVSVLLEKDNSKGLSNALKALGLNSTEIGALFTETATMQGRGVGELNLRKSAKERTSHSWVNDHIIKCDPEELRSHVRFLIRSELSEGVVLPDLDKWWSQRWLWCVNGSQNRGSDDALELDNTRTAGTHTRRYRRMAAEEVRRNPVTTWDGTTYVSASQKLEHGKTRAIFACDTASYFAFSWILGQTQKDWHNDRILLDPGQGGSAGIVRRIQHAQLGGGVNLMLDYDDFNSQHSIPSMQVVMEELCYAYSAPDWYREMIVKSLGKQYVKVGTRYRRVVGTLMSGHRATTFLNSVLNAAYIRLAIGSAAYDPIVALHTGDDVYMRPHTLRDAVNCLEKSASIGCRMNPTKQSIGFRHAEFLRMAISSKEARGYPARAIASLTTGNWVNMNPLEPAAGLLSVITSVRSIINRGGSKTLPQVVAPAVKYTRGISVKTVQALLGGTVAIEGSPVYNVDFVLRTYRVQNDMAPTTEVQPQWARYATQDYLTDHVSPVELTAIDAAGVDVTKLLVASSYTKGLDKKMLPTRPHLKLVKNRPRRAGGITSVTSLLKVKKEVGCLAGYPILNLLKNQLSVDVLRELIRDVGGDHTAHDVYVEAFGKDSRTHNVIGILPFSDAAELGKRTLCDNIRVDFPIAM